MSDDTDCRWFSQDSKRRHWKSPTLCVSVPDRHFQVLGTMWVCPSLLLPWQRRHLSWAEYLESVQVKSVVNRRGDTVRLRYTCKVTAVIVCDCVGGICDSVQDPPSQVDCSFQHFQTGNSIILLCLHTCSLTQEFSLNKIITLSLTHSLPRFTRIFGCTRVISFMCPFFDVCILMRVRCVCILAGIWQSGV